MGVQDGGGDPWGESHTVFIVGTLSQASDTHWKHMCLLSTNHTSEKSLKSRYLYSLFRSQELTDSRAQRVQAIDLCQCPLVKMGLITVFTGLL